MQSYRNKVTSVSSRRVTSKQQNTGTNLLFSFGGKLDCSCNLAAGCLDDSGNLGWDSLDTASNLGVEFELGWELAYGLDTLGIVHLALNDTS